MVWPRPSALEFTQAQISKFGGAVPGSFADCPIHLVLTTLSSGGKGGAPLIQNDHQFGVVLAALLKKDKTKVHTSMEIDLDDMEGFLIKQVVNINISGISIQLILLNGSCLQVSLMQQLWELRKSWCTALM